MSYLELDSENVEQTAADTFVSSTPACYLKAGRSRIQGAARLSSAVVR